MLVSARTTFALRCAHCGKLETVELSRFDVHEGSSTKLNCSCGNSIIIVGRKRKQVSVQLPCYLCDGVHFSFYSPRHFWSEELKQITCAETDLQLGAFGDEAAVKTFARPGGSELDRLLEDEAFDDYFEDRETMYQAVTLVNTLSDYGKVSCACGSKRISIDLYPDRLELTCEDCGAHKSLYACNEEDAVALQVVTYIEVGDDLPPRRKATRNSRDRE